MKKMQSAVMRRHTAEGMLHQLTWKRLLSLLLRCLPRLKAPRHRQSTARTAIHEAVVLEDDMGSKDDGVWLTICVRQEKKLTTRQT